MNHPLNSSYCQLGDEFPHPRTPTIQVDGFSGQAVVIVVDYPQLNNEHLAAKIILHNDSSQKSIPFPDSANFSTIIVHSRRKLGVFIEKYWQVLQLF